MTVAVVANISVCMVGHEPTHYERKVPTIGEFCQRLESRLFKTYNMREAFKTIAMMVIVMFPNNWCVVYHRIVSQYYLPGDWEMALLSSPTTSSSSCLTFTSRKGEKFLPGLASFSLESVPRLLVLSPLSSPFLAFSFPTFSVRGFSPASLLVSLITKQNVFEVRKVTSYTLIVICIVLQG